MVKAKKNKAKIILLSLLLTLAVILLAIFFTITIIYFSTPLNVDALKSTNLGVEIYSETTQPIYCSTNRALTSFDELQPHTINAFISIEDKRFYEHNGYDLKRILKAGFVNLTTHSKSQGASTITQQLVKNALLNSEKTYSRKIKEIMLAIKTEKAYSKQEILDMYLNSIYFGSNAYGIESASQLYFGVPASELSINQSAILAGVIKSPAYYSPISHPDNCIRRKNLVLKQMFDNGYITEQQYTENTYLGLEISEINDNTYDNSYNQQAIIEACELLNISEKQLLRSEYKIYTYLNEELQNSLHTVLLNSEFSGDKLSLIANNNGQILAYLGNSNYDLSKMKRNPASTIKPLLIYLPAIAKNLISPASPLLDEKLEQEYSPKNAGNLYLGWTTAREALSHSSNVCAVQLLNKLGYDTINEYGYKLNLLTSPISNPSLALGDIQNGITILDLARAYSVLQNNGKDKSLTFISKIEDKNGNIIYSNSGYENQIFAEEDCMLINDMLQTCATSGTAKRLADLPFGVASKTGTAQINGKNTDLWNVAYTPEHLVVSWCGDATSRGLEGGYSSSFYPTLINKNLLKKIYSTYSPTPFKLNDNIVKIGYDTIKWNDEHELYLSTPIEPERYIKYDLFKQDNLPENYSPAFSSPQFNLNVSLTTKGCVITLDDIKYFNFKVYAVSSDTTYFVGEYTGEPLVDDKVFKYQYLNYYAVATNVYNQQQYTSESVYVNPEEYLVNMLNNEFIQRQSTKTKWYI